MCKPCFSAGGAIVDGQAGLEQNDSRERGSLQKPSRPVGPSVYSHGTASSSLSVVTRRMRSGLPSSGRSSTSSPQGITRERGTCHTPPVRWRVNQALLVVWTSQIPNWYGNSSSRQREAPGSPSDRNGGVWHVPLSRCYSLRRRVLERHLMAAGSHSSCYY